MARRGKFTSSRRKKNHMLGVLVIISIGACIVTSVLAGTFIYVNGSINRNEAAITTLSDDLTTIKEKVETIKGQEEEYKNQLQSLELELSKYQPIVIPDSMK